ncbi:MAG: transcription-repair coupling factor [Eubacteriales bacterium]|nr:transcription-repair coupling factor [Eubacteriales bacterium]
MKENIFEILYNYPAFKQLLDEAVNNRCVALYDMPPAFRIFVAAALGRKLKKTVLYAVPSLKLATSAEENAMAITGGRAVYLPAQDMQFIKGTYSKERRWQELKILSDVNAGNIDLLIVTPESFLRRFPRLIKQDFTIAKGSVLEPQELIIKLVSMGYERVDMVEGKGQCALRGDIMDIFPPVSDNPVRIEFFDNEVDSIRFFDTLSQNSISQEEQVNISLADMYMFSADNREEAAQKMQNLIKSAIKGRSSSTEKTKILDDDLDLNTEISLASGYRRTQTDIDRLKESGTFNSMHLWYPLLAQTIPIEQFLDDAILVLDTPNRIKSRLENEYQAFRELLSQAVLREDAVKEQEALYYSVEEITERLKSKKPVLMQDMLLGFANIEPDVALSMPAQQASDLYRGDFKRLAEDINANIIKGFAIGIATQSPARAERIINALKTEGYFMPPYEENENLLAHGKAGFISLPLSEGFVSEDAKLMLVSQADLYGRSYKKRKSNPKGQSIDAFVELNQGDYVVHEQHGIGIYEGTVRLQSEGAYRDYLYIRYNGTDKLYIPVDQFDRVQKYIGAEGDAPKLNSLDSTNWEKQKARVKKSLQKLAFSLVKLYAQRQSIPGFEFQEYPEWEEQFNDNFEYELTDDQQKAIDEVLTDMSKPINMDRLLCGDVGYGKTEVAMRAAFRAAVNGKQVALLAPTTILVQQHLNTFKQRFRGFPLKIAAISRFSTPKENKKALQSLSEGAIDIVIGTHRLLSKDVKFKDLGLLMVDEEQRFGVGHKESIKNIKKTVDVLSLSATPIPRTLHMSMVGVRDMSIIESPPQERQPVQSYVVESNDAVVRDAALREINRGGQLYFLYNRVQHMEVFAAKLRKLLPEAKIAIAHGQLRSQVLEDIMLDFSLGRYDILLCSTIIENGIDIPNANTLIVYDADRFGLSQLYQLRGRVGRSTRLAYAYFLVRPDKALSETAEKRLSAIREFTEFGAGFRIAMRDLQIRGAGNIFGPEQSGQISSIGYDMYCKMLEEAVLEAQGEIDKADRFKRDCRVDIHLNAFLPEEYISGNSQRVEIYKRISQISTEDDKFALIEDMIDRFGEPPQTVQTLLDVALLRSFAIELGCDIIKLENTDLSFRLNPEYIRDPVGLLKALQEEPDVKLTSGKNTWLIVKVPSGKSMDALNIGIMFLKKMQKKLNYKRSN